MTNGAEDLLSEFGGDRVAIAIALVKGEIDGYKQRYCDELLNDSIRWAAKTRLDLQDKSVQRWARQ